MGGAVFFLVLLAVALTGSDEQVTRRVLVAKRFIRYVPPAHLKNQGWFAKRKRSDAWKLREVVLNEAFTTMEATHRKDLDELTDAVAGQDTPLQTQARKQKISADKNDVWSCHVANLKSMLLSRNDTFKVLKGMLGKAQAAIKAKQALLMKARANAAKLNRERNAFENKFLAEQRAHKDALTAIEKKDKQLERVNELATALADRITFTAPEQSNSPRPRSSSTSALHVELEKLDKQLINQNAQSQQDIKAIQDLIKPIQIELTKTFKASAER